MSAASWLAWVLVGLTLAMFASSVALSVLTQSVQSPGNWVTVGAISDTLSFMSFLAFPWWVP
jgi:hypothetical protein